MKTVILAGGYGTRLSEETDLRPKSMVEIGGRPILWHIMKIYSYWGFNEFVVLTGYKSHVIKDYFINYYTRYSDITVDMAANRVEIHRHRNEPWKVTMLYTGQDTMTGGRLLAAKDVLAVAHRRFKEMGIGMIRSFGRDKQVLYDLKYVFPRETTDLRF
jgi:glucose-1-phosphate cytidylyltransferase